MQDTQIRHQEPISVRFNSSRLLKKIRVCHYVVQVGLEILIFLPEPLSAGIISMCTVPG